MGGIQLINKLNNLFRKICDNKLLQEFVEAEIKDKNSHILMDLELKRCQVCKVTKLLINYSTYEKTGKLYESCNKCREYIKRCIFEDESGKRCNTVPNFNYSCEYRGLYCNDHKLQGMVNVTSKTCLECGTRPCFNNPEETIGIYCDTHKKPGMVNVVDKKCNNKNCNITPSFNYPGEICGLYCWNHKLPDMINVKEHRKCVVDNCYTRPHFNYPGETKGLYCAKHQLPGKMVNVVSVTCEECNVRPSFNFPDEKWGRYCVNHKSDDMVDVVNPKCMEKGCKIQPVFNLKNEKRPVCCAAHKTEKMEDIRTKRCIECKLIQSRKGPNNDYCARCYYYKFPNEVIPRRYMMKENYIYNDLKKLYPSIQHNVTLRSGLKPDFLINCNDYNIIIECDEEQHNREKYCTCEDTRIYKIMEDLDYKFLYVIRFNPDNYVNDKKQKIKSCFSYDKRNNLIVDTEKYIHRMDTLKNIINECVTNKLNDELLFVYHLFYNGFNDN